MADEAPDGGTAPTRPATVRLYHASDLHGHLGCLAGARAPVDGWVLTGDVFPDAPVGDYDTRRKHARNWFRRETRALREAFGALPVLVVNGNHDFEDLAEHLRGVGVDARAVTPGGLTFLGRRVAGFPHIPRMRGHWNHEATPEELARRGVRRGPPGQRAARRRPGAPGTRRAAPPLRARPPDGRGPRRARRRAVLQRGAGGVPRRTRRGPMSLCRAPRPVRPRPIAPAWTAGVCGYGDCPCTLVMYVGGGQWCCWLHALALRLPLARPPGR